jgi:hypothetical protein
VVVVYKGQVVAYPPGNIMEVISKTGILADTAGNARYKRVATELVRAAGNMRGGGTIEAIRKSEYNNIRWTGGALKWDSPGWKPGEYKSGQRWALKYATAVRAWNGLVTDSVSMVTTTTRVKYEMIVWNVRNFCNTTALNMEAWVASRNNRKRKVGMICLTETWQHPEENMPELTGFDTVIQKPRTLHAAQGSKKSGGVAVYIHNDIQHLITDAERETTGSFEAAVAVKIHDPNMRRDEFVAVVYGERSRPSAGVVVHNEQVVDMVAQWQQQLNGPLTIVGDQNVHVGEAEYQKWIDRLGVNRLDTGGVATYSKLDDKRQEGHVGRNNVHNRPHICS